MCPLSTALLSATPSALYSRFRSVFAQNCTLREKACWKFSNRPLSIKLVVAGVKVGHYSYGSNSNRGFILGQGKTHSHDRRRRLRDVAAGGGAPRKGVSGYPLRLRWPINPLHASGNARQ